MFDATGLPLTCSNQAAMDSFNKGLLAFVTLREKSFPFFEQASKEDPNFVVAHSVMGYLLMYYENKPPSNLKVAALLGMVNSIVNSHSLPVRDMGYVRAFQSYASGDLLKAIEVLTAMLLEHPQDALAMQIIVRSCLAVGEFERLRDTLSWALSFWDKDMELYPFVMSFYGYALEECNERNKAERILRSVLDMNSDTPFAYHGMSHVMEEEKKASSGIEFLTSSRSHWSTSVYNVHLTWHLSLYYLDLGDNDSVLREFDDVISKSVTPDNFPGLLDASSLLWRLNAIDVDPGEERWKRVTDAMEMHVNNHRSPWFSAHIMMSLARGKVCEATARLALAEGMIKSMESYCGTEGVFNQNTCEKFGLPVCNALLAFGKEKYDEVLQIMLPLHYGLHHIGGSWAQRQVFNTTMIEAAVRANNIPVAIGLVSELRSRKPHSQRLNSLLMQLEEKYSTEKEADSIPSKKIKLSSII